MPTPADREPAAHPFAELLRQSRGVEHLASAAQKLPTELGTTRSEPGSEPAAASDETTPTQDSSPKSDAGRARARAGATGARHPARPAVPRERPERGPERIAEWGAQEHDRSPANASNAAATPAMALRPDTPRATDNELRLGAAARRSPLSVGAGRETDSSAAGATTTAIEFGAEQGGAPRRAAADGLGRADTGHAARSRDGEASTPAASFTQILADAQAADRSLSAAVSAEPPPLPATAVAAPEAQAPASADISLAPQAATLPVPVDSPEFAAAFGVQVSVFVREGVQHAELHLNPVETGPVSIAITLEGTQAHVEFGADLAATREAIENGLPALASALRDAGFTLAGGGVAQHSRSGGGHPHEDAPGGSGRRTARNRESIAAPTVQRATRRVAAGGIDLYA
ncbi:MAG: flagellar hook-length control protein FliK [Polyangiaceae bacterium]